MPAIIAAIVARAKPLLSFVPGVGILSGVATVFAAVVAFFSTTLGQWIGIAIIGVCLFLAGDIHRERLDKAKYEKAVEVANQERTARDASIAQSTLADAQKQTTDIQTKADALQAKVSDYEKELASRPSNSCGLTPADVDRLRKF